MIVGCGCVSFSLWHRWVFSLSWVHSQDDGKSVCVSLSQFNQMAPAQHNKTNTHSSRFLHVSFGVLCFFLQKHFDFSHVFFSMFFCVLVLSFYVGIPGFRFWDGCPKTCVKIALFFRLKKKRFGPWYFFILGREIFFLFIYLFYFCFFVFE